MDREEIIKYLQGKLIEVDKKSQGRVGKNYYLGQVHLLEEVLIKLISSSNGI